MVKTDNSVYEQNQGIITIVDSRKRQRDNSVYQQNQDIITIVDVRKRGKPPFFLETITATKH